MIVCPQGTPLKSAFVASLLKCSRGWGDIALTVVHSTQVQVHPNTYVNMIQVEDMLAIKSPTPLWGRIKFCTADFYIEGGILKHGEWGYITIWMLRKRLAGTWYYSNPGSPQFPTPMAVRSAYCPRAFRTNTGDYSTYHAFPSSTKIKVYGACWGLLCHYPGQYYAESSDVDPFGPEDIYMRRISPASFVRKNQGAGDSFEFTPSLPALPVTADNPEGGPALSIFWPGRRPEDFPWYLSTGDAGFSTSEGPSTTD